MSTETTVLLVRAQRLEFDAVLSLVLEHPDGSELPVWTPGAHIGVVLPSGTGRQYSLCSDPAEKTQYRIAVLNDPNSRGGSREIHETVRTGSLLPYRGPRETTSNLNRHRTTCSSPAASASRRSWPWPGRSRRAVDAFCRRTGRARRNREHHPEG